MSLLECVASKSLFQLARYSLKQVARASLRMQICELEVGNVFFFVLLEELNGPV